MLNVRPNSRARLVVGLWLSLFAAALVLDGPVARWVVRNHPVNKASVVKRWVKRPGDFRYAWVLIPVAMAAHATRWRAGVTLALASAFAGILYSTKWLYGRHRPSFAMEPYTLHPFIGGPRGLLHATALSFPSGHTCLSFALASSFAALFPRSAVTAYLIASAVGVERVLEGAHYPSDVVAGAAFGVLATRLAVWVCESWAGRQQSLAIPSRPDVAHSASGGVSGAVQS
jgi:membrane-associated phospholipid phosphatase